MLSVLVFDARTTSVRHSDGDEKDFVTWCAYRRSCRQRSFCGTDVRRFQLETCSRCTGGHGKDRYGRDQRGDGRNNVIRGAMITNATTLWFVQETMTHYDGQYEGTKIRQLSRLGVTSAVSESFTLTRTIIGWGIAAASSARGNKRKRHPIKRKKLTSFTNGTQTCVWWLRGTDNTWNLKRGGSDCPLSHDARWKCGDD